IRGALSKLTSLSHEEIKKGVAAISSGNHGGAVSHGASILGIDNVNIFVPETTPESKLEKIRYYKGKITKLGKNYDETHTLGLEKIKKEENLYIDGCSDKEVIAGQGSIALEILEDNPLIDTILVPIGGG